MEIAAAEKLANKFACALCDYGCRKESDYKKHLLTGKHLKRANGNKIEIIVNEKIAIEYKCKNCNKIYNTCSGLWKHNKNCKESPHVNEPPSESEVKMLTNLVVELVKSNADLQKQTHDMQKQVLDIFQKIQPSTTNINSNNTNSHNKTFNLQFFLNEQCKDAMNIMDFVNTFQLQFSDFERIGEVGYVEGISKIIIDKLSSMDIYKRPIHCSDAKREIMYVKDKDVWEKENPTNSKIRLAVRHISKKNSDMVRPWLIKHPGALYSDHHLSDAYQVMIIESMGGNSGTLEECENKIIKKISKMVLIDKKI